MKTFLPLIRDLETIRAKNMDVTIFDNSEDESVEKWKKYWVKYCHGNKYPMVFTAPQVGYKHRIMVCNLGDDWIVCYNPRYKFRGKKKETVKESCPNVKDAFGNYVEYPCPRYIKIQATFNDENGDRVDLILSGEAAYAFQQGADFCNGIFPLENLQ